MPALLVFVLRPVELRVQPQAFQLITMGRIPQELTGRLRGTSFPVGVSVDTGSMRIIITAPVDFFANLHVNKWGSTTILGRSYDTKEMLAALPFNGTTFPRVEVEVTNRNIEANDDFVWQGIIGMDVVLKCSVYIDKGRFLMLGYDENETGEIAIT